MPVPTPVGRRTSGNEWRKMRDGLETLWCWQGRLTPGTGKVLVNFKNYIDVRFLTLQQQLVLFIFPCVLLGGGCRNDLATCITPRSGISRMTVATHFCSVEVKMDFFLQEKKRKKLSNFWRNGILGSKMLLYSLNSTEIPVTGWAHICNHICQVIYFSK